MIDFCESVDEIIDEILLLEIEVHSEWLWTHSWWCNSLRESNVVCRTTKYILLSNMHTLSKEAVRIINY